MEAKNVVQQEQLPLKEAKRAFLVGVYLSTKEKERSLEYLEELKRLCDTFGIAVVGFTVCPIKKFDAGTYLGKGKLEEILGLADELQADAIIFDDEIAPKQQRNLEAFFKRSVADRTELIIEVFAKRAQTREAQLQIELARIKYQFPRLRRMWTHLSRQSSGGGFVKGEGEKQIEIDRRLLRKRIDVMNKEIEEVIAQRNTQRSARKRSGIPTFAIVGYTNAGKSTLMKTLTGADVYVEDKLFATLDTKARKYTLPNNQEILFVDTVGFIRKIPHTLVAAFKSTLEEAVHTDILLHLIDVSHPLAEEQAEATLSVLKELGAEDRPIVTVLNKIDACEDPEKVEALRNKYPGAVAISALSKQGVDNLLDKVAEEVANLRKVFHLRIPQSEYKLVSDLMRDGRVLTSDYEDNDVLITVEVPLVLEHKVKPYEINS